MTFRMVLFLGPITCNEKLRYMIRELLCVVVCSVLVPADYILNISACADVSSDSIYNIYRCDTALFGFFESKRL